MNSPNSAFFYHLYPLGCFGAPHANDGAPCSRLRRIEPWLDHIRDLGADTLLLGPVFQSETHGYDTTNYFTPDSRLGTGDDLAWAVEQAHARGIRVVFDAVFNHVGRSFWAFQDVVKNRQNSRFAPWFFCDFTRQSPPGDPFDYTAWRGHYELVKLNTDHPDVRNHLLHAAGEWISRYGIDGLRLDAADCLDLGFQRALAEHCRTLRPGFYLLGEVIHGDYARWVDQGGLDAVTNYILHKGLWSSHNDANYFELAHTCRKQFTPGSSAYRWYTFADNHDVTRIRSRLRDPAHLYPLHILLFTLPGTPSVYYGSEYGLEGAKRKGRDDWPLRPALTPESLRDAAKEPDLARAIQTLARLRREHPALALGEFTEMRVTHTQYGFKREHAGETALVCVNAAHEQTEFVLQGDIQGMWRDVLNGGAPHTARNGRLAVPLPPCWGSILIRQ
ncbi:Alpha amylase catalytic region [uncultured delta proteobacterium]|uniref:Alpha amylase catalytic region n=1 Tax=uncultured delta proteobacterium TaxID=34034 RepID=A0A212K7G5_9DELT|nr:Alpha amylase catalytic region [uncultured delta proteobacterium]